MNERFDFLGDGESQLLDRLVDGNLSVAEQRRLISSLETRPDGWRKCAMAFLEAHTWKAEFAELMSDRRPRINGASEAVVNALSNGASDGVALADQHRKVERMRPAQPAAIGSKMNRARVLVTAASIGLAFLLGVAAGGYRSNDPDSSALGKASDDQGIAHANNVQKDHRSSPPNDSQAPLYSTTPTVTMTVVGGNGAGERQFEIPIVETDRLDNGWLAGQPAAIPPQAADELRRRGYRVDEQRLLVPVVLDDGRRAILPFDQAEVTYAGMQF